MFQHLSFWPRMAVRRISMTFQDKIFITVFILVLVTCAISFYSIMTGPRKVTIDSKHFICTETQPIGLEAECTNYRKVSLNARQ